MTKADEMREETSLPGRHAEAEHFLGVLSHEKFSGAGRTWMGSFNALYTAV